MNPFLIGCHGRVLGRGHRVYIALECGGTHTGLESALALVNAAAEVKVDAAKFQILDADLIVAEDSPVRYTHADGHPRETSMRDILRRRALHPADWQRVAERAHHLGLD